MLLPACLKRQLNGGWWAFVAKSITAQSIKDEILVQFLFQFSAQTSQKKNILFIPDNSVYNNARLQKSDVSGPKRQIEHANTRQCIFFSRLCIVSAVSLRINKEEKFQKLLPNGRLKIKGTPSLYLRLPHMVLISLNKAASFLPR